MSYRSGDYDTSSDKPAVSFRSAEHHFEEGTVLNTYECLEDTFFMRKEWGKARHATHKQWYLENGEILRLW